MTKRQHNLPGELNNAAKSPSKSAIRALHTTNANAHVKRRVAGARWFGRKGIIGIASLALIGVVAGCGTTSANASGSGSNTAAGKGSGGTIVIGGKNFTEQSIMADMLTLLVQHDTNLKVKQDTWLDSNVTWTAMKDGDIDAYVEYTGTGLVNILHDKTTTDPQLAYNEVKKQFQSKYHITWLKPIGFNDTYAMVMRSSEAKRLGITDISQLAAQSGNLVLGSDTDFTSRADSLPAMNKLYKTHFKRVSTMEIGLKYKALLDKKVDVIDGFSTDPQIAEYHLTVLKDNKHLFPPYYAAPIIRDSTLKKYPELKTVFNKLAGKINDSEMQKLNYDVDVKHETAMQVATTWLTQHKLI